MKTLNTLIALAWRDLDETQPTIVPIFYSRLFGLRPALRAKYPAELEETHRVCGELLERWVRQVEDEDGIAGIAREFRDANPAIPTDDYVFVGEALVYAICTATYKCAHPVDWQDTRDDWLTAIGGLIFALESLDDSSEAAEKKATEREMFSALRPEDFGEILDAISKAGSQRDLDAYELGLRAFKHDLLRARKAIEIAEQSRYFNIEGRIDAKTLQHRLAVNHLRAKLNELLAALQS